MVTRRDGSAITKQTRSRWSPASVSNLGGEQIAGREALPVRLQERLPGHAPAPLGSRVDPVVVQDPLHRGPSDLVAEVRERPSCALGFSWTLDCERVLAGGVSR